jgi:outer membrane protein TolC
MRSLVAGLVLAGLSAGAALAQTAGAPMPRLTFDEAVERAAARHPTVAQAAAGILRAEAILQQVRAGTRPLVDASATTNVIHPVQSFGGASINPRTQLNLSMGLMVPLLAPVAWARQTQAGDQVAVARRGEADVRRAIAIGAAQAFLQVIALKRVQELNERSRDTAAAHYEYARQRFEGGLGSRLNLLRAQQELSTDETRVEEARLAVRRGQEALGVLVAADGPVDAAAEPVFEIPSEDADGGVLARRADLQLVGSRESAAERVVRDSWREYLPSVSGLFAPQVLAPSGLFLPSRSWRATVVVQLPLFDAGGRRGLRRERESLLDFVRAERTGLEREARSEVRAAREAVRSTERALASARAAADQAAEVVRITDVAFRAGATTNIEVIDAQRRARDAATASAIAEDAVRRARLELLAALGHFPK